MVTHPMIKFHLFKKHFISVPLQFICTPPALSSHMCTHVLNKASHISSVALCSDTCRSENQTHDHKTKRVWPWLNSKQTRWTLENLVLFRQDLYLSHRLRLSVKQHVVPIEGQKDKVNDLPQRLLLLVREVCARTKLSVHC